MSLAFPTRGRPLARPAIAGSVIIVGAVAGWKSDTIGEAIAVAAFGLFMVWVVSGDMQDRPIPSAALAAAGLGASCLLVLSSFGAEADTELLRPFAAGALMAAVLMVFHLLYPDGLGSRSVILGGIVAVFVGSISWSAVWVTFALASVLAGVVTAYLVLARQQSPKLLLPTSPFFAASALIAVVVFG